MKKMALILAGIGISFGGYARAENLKEKVTEKAAQARLEERLSEEMNIATLQTTWQRCDVFVSRPRGTGRRVRVVKPWSCKEIQTSCGAVISDEKAYVSEICYQVRKKEDQILSLQRSVLMENTGKKRSLLKAFYQKVKGFVVFHLQ